MFRTGGGGANDRGGGGGGISAFKQKIKNWTHEQLNIPNDVWKSNKYMYTEAQKDAIKAERRSRGKQQPSPGKNG